MGRGLGDWDVGRVFGTWDAWAGTWGRGDVGTLGCANEDFRNENLTRVARVDLYGLET